MSLSRFTARVLAISALLSQPGDTDLVTMAGDKVFDSRLDPLQFNEDQSDIPAITVYTDEDDAKLLNMAGAGGPYRRHVTLRLEITVATMAEFQGPEGQPMKAPCLMSTDEELEAQLDLFEQQVRWALLGIAGRPATAAFATWVIRVNSISSSPVRDPENNRMSSRRMMFDLEVPDDCPPLVYVQPGNGSTYGQGAPQGCVPMSTMVTTTFPGKIEVTPCMFPNCPWLAQMFVTMQCAPSYRSVISRLAKTGEPSIILPAFQRMQAAFGLGGSKNPSDTVQTSGSM